MDERVMEHSMSDQPFPEGDPVSHDLAMLGGGGDDAMASVFQELDDLPASPHHAGPTGLEAVHEVPVKVQAVLGRAQMPVGDLVARGEVVLVDHALGVTLTEIVRAGR
jgi:flagellar motor switch protein FliN/FliY